MKKSDLKENCLRPLALKDAPLMHEWMQDDSVVRDLQNDFHQMTVDDCESFIEQSLMDNDNLHLAIVNANDEYQGTVSLKHVTNESAEFAIVIRSNAFGKGIAKNAMEEIIRIGFEEKGLEYIYWCVSPKNKRAVRFYEKNGYTCVSPNNITIVGYNKELIKSYQWYMITRTFYKIEEWF